MGFFDKILDVATVGAYGAVTGKGFDITGKGAAQDANRQNLASQQNIAGATNKTVRDMFNTSRSDQMPFIQPSLSALPMYQSAVLGGPVQYSDPNYRKLTAFDPGYAEGIDQYYAPDGSIVDKAPMLSANYQLENDPGFQWRNKQLDRSLRSLGRSNSTYGMQAKADFSGNEYDRSLSRLSTLAGFGQGANNQMAQNNQQAASQTANVNSNLANSLSGLYKNQAGLYTNYSPLNLGLNAAKVGAAFI